MDRLIKKADRKAVAALKEKIKCSDNDGHLNNPKVRRYWKDRYIRVLWEHVFDLANDKSADEASRMIIAFDNHIACVEQIVEDALKAYMKETKTSEGLHTAASAILSDLLATEKNDWFNISLQKNGRLCCRVLEYADWLPGKTFRTTWDNLRGDFAEALKDLRTRREFAIEE